MIGLRIALLTALLLLPRAGALGIEVVAVAGRPFGIGRISLPLAANGEDLIIETNGYLLTEADERVFYPAFAHRRVLGLLRDLIGVESPARISSLTVFFLFQGDDPLQLTLRTPEPQKFVVVPEYNPHLFSRLQRAWWQQYTAAAALLEREGDYPPIVEVYLSKMLEQRLGLRTPLRRRARTRSSIPKESLQLVLNIESMRMQAFEDVLQNRVDRGLANQALPQSIQWSDRELPNLDEEPTIEPIAEHVPEECFYARFGSFDNYLWLRNFSEQNGGSASRLITLRGHDAEVNQRIQNQLGLRETALAALLGNRLISDVALIGRDTYVREGAAIGILFEARSGLLRNEFMSQRTEATARWESAGATMSDIEVGSQTVSFASTPGNELRSYYAIDGRYHLVTNCVSIVERFFAAGQGVGSLAQSAEFRLARQNFPIAENDTLFAFLSPAFFRGLASPQYQIELRRRLRAVTELEIVSLARLAAQHERQPDERIEDLIAAGLLPDEFGQRPDGSQVVLQEDDIRDSLRGSRGSFLPIPDVPLQGVTQEEMDRFAELARFHQQHWTQMDPLVVQVQRTPIPDTERERLEIHAEMLPFERAKYGLATSIIGPPSTRRVQQSDDDAITVQAMLQGGLFNPNVGQHHVFFGLRDEELPIELSDISLVRTMQVLRRSPAYLGAWPALGLASLIPLRTAPTPEANGLMRLPFGLWQLSTPEGFSLLGTDPQLLSRASQELDVEEVEDEAQLRIHVTDVSQAKITTWFAALDFQRAYRTSVGNTRLLHTMTQQLGVAPAESRLTTERLLGATLICALAGDYELRQADDGRSYWVSTNWPRVRAPDEEGGQFASPMLAWFRGLDAEFRLLRDRISAHATVEIKQLSSGQPTLPFFNLLRRR